MGSCAMAEMRAASGASDGTVPRRVAASWGAVAQTTASKTRAPSVQREAPLRGLARERDDAAAEHDLRAALAQPRDGGIGQQRREVEGRQHELRILAAAHEGVAQHAGEHARVRPVRGRVERGHAQGLPDEPAKDLRLRVALQEFRHRLALAGRFLGAPDGEGEGEGGRALHEAEPVREGQRRGEMQRSRKPGGGELEEARVVDGQRLAPHGVHRHAHGAHEGERAAVGAQQDVLPVVEHGAAVLDAARAPAGRAVGVEQGDRGPALHQSHRRRDPRVPRADDGHAPRAGRPAHARIHVFHAIQSLRIGVRETRPSSTGKPSRRISARSVR